MAALRWLDPRHTGVVAALGAAALFGAGTPLAKWLLGALSPWLLAGLLYLGSGIGLLIYRALIRAPAAHLPRQQVPWLAGAIVAGGIVGPVLLMFGLSGMPAAGASLLLNAEGVFTALLAWFAFKENFDRRIALGMLAILAGAAILSWPAAVPPGAPGELRLAALWPALAVLGACLAWGIDNNLTRKVALTDAAWIAAIKGLVAGVVNLALAFSLGAKVPPLPILAAAMLVGFVAYGVSLALFVVGLRHLGTARTGAYFSIAPFVGAALALLMGEPATPGLLIAGALMALGLWLHLTERHEHQHTHEALTHDHAHVHDEHHQHAHEDDPPIAPGAAHRHPHQHTPVSHVHRHFPDAHHGHRH